MKKLISSIFFSILTSFTCIFSQNITAKIHKISKNTYSLYLKVDATFEKFYLDTGNSYASLVDQDSIDLGSYEIFYFNNKGVILREFTDKNPDEIKFIRLNLIFRDSTGVIKKHPALYYELYIKENKFLLEKNLLYRKELKVYFNENKLSRLFIWSSDGKLVSALDVYSGISESIHFLHNGMYFVNLSGFDNTEKIIVK